jgi:2-dehydro-3-deoxyphosphooctonate aldolase (KDO 8-P synthase)
METHPNPAVALSDGPNAWALGEMQALLQTLQVIDAAIKAQVLPENALMK